MTLQDLRQHFPSLHHPTADGSLPIFLDNPAGTQVPQVVIDAVTEYYITMNANSGGTFATSERSDAMVAQARQAFADFINAPSPNEIAFGPTMTAHSFALSRAIAKTLKAGDEIVLTKMDHDANVAPWLRVAEDLGLTVKWVDIRTEDATLDMDSFEAALSEKTKIVATVHAANSVGTINPVSQIADMAHAAGAYHIVDAVQSAPHIPIDVQVIGCDFLMCSAYKFYGPHIGILWGKYELMNSLPAYKVRPAKDKSPDRWEIGTQSFETINGVKAALNYIADVGVNYGGDLADQFNQYTGRRRDFKVGMTVMANYERDLVAYMIEQLQTVEGIHFAGITDPNQFEHRVPTVALRKDGHHPDEIAAHLAKHNIYVWSGHYYAVEIMDRLGYQESGGMVRVGLAHYNTRDEIDSMISALQKLD